MLVKISIVYKQHCSGSHGKSKMISRVIHNTDSCLNLLRLSTYLIHKITIYDYDT